MQIVRVTLVSHKPDRDPTDIPIHAKVPEAPFYYELLVHDSQDYSRKNMFLGARENVVWCLSGLRNPACEKIE